jgi:cyclopropane-fatty-acyl-phospholipid synthase
MGKNRYEEIVDTLLAGADIAINGSRPWDIRVRDERFYRRVLGGGSLALGESYMDGWWECEKLDELFFRLIPSGPEEKIKRNWRSIVHVLGAMAVNRGSASRAFQVGERHYDLGNELYRNMLDRRMIYSCAYWKEARDLDSAQEAKLNLICRKLTLRPGDRVLDIGCGWGGFAAFAAERYGVQVVGITVSKEQAELARERCNGLPIEIRLQDYRDVSGRFDHIVSVGMLEHVGYRNYRTYMQVAHRCLKDDGLFLLHTIGKHETGIANDPWFDRYIFPNYLLPSMKQLSAAIEKLFVVEDWHNFGADYDPTLLAWFRNFDATWVAGKGRQDERFYRMWKYYLLSCAAMFRCRQLQVWQIVLSGNGVAGGYRSVR